METLRKRQVKASQLQENKSIVLSAYCIRTIIETIQSVKDELGSDVEKALNTFKNLWKLVQEMNTGDDLTRRDVSHLSSKFYENLTPLQKSLRNVVIDLEQQLAIAIKDCLWNDFTKFLESPNRDISPSGQSIRLIVSAYDIMPVYNSVILSISGEIKLGIGKLETIVSHFEEWIIASTFYKDTAVRSFLTRIIEQEDQSFTTKILVKIRSIILNDSFEVYNIESKDVEDSSSSQAKEAFLPDETWKYPNSQCRQSTIEIINTFHKLLETAKNERSPIRIKRICEATNEIFDMFYTISPYFLDDKIDSSPGLAALFYNDCMFIAYHLYRASMSMKHQISSLLNETFSMHEYAQKIEIIGNRYFERLVYYQQTKFLDLFNQGNFFNPDPRNGSSKDSTVKLLLFQFKKLGRATKAILPEAIYHQFLGMVIGHVINHIVNHILSTDDITVEESETYHQFFMRLFELEKLFDLRYDPLHYIQCWGKFKTLVLIMDMKLIDIAVRYKGDPYLSKHELVHIIRALFSDSPLRREQINIILGD